jgi:hypothetical protein
VSVWTLILLIVTSASWMAVAVNRRDIAAFEARIKQTAPLARELVVDDARQVAVVKTDELWYDDNEWDLYLPAGAYRLCLATRGVDSNGFPGEPKRVPLAAGRHRIRLDQRSDQPAYVIAALCDGAEVLRLQEPNEWDAGSGSEGGGRFSTSTQSDPRQPVVLMRRRFFGPRDANGRSSAPAGPTNGILLWIEPAPGPGDGHGHGPPA